MLLFFRLGIAYLGRRNASQLKRHLDEDYFETSAKGVGPLFASTHRTLEKGKPIPNARPSGPGQGGWVARCA
ncbi:hypothetical protein NBRC116601_21520 [Cognatishimia sp. WU-CL00825]